LRSFNRNMPEEINRVIADRLSQLLLCPSETAVTNLRNEGITEGVHLVGDVMHDSLAWARQQAPAYLPSLLPSLRVSVRAFVLCTIHRSENTDQRSRLAGILRALNDLEEPVIFPMHPRTRRVIASIGIELRAHIRAIDLVCYLQMIALADAARVILTDSGGLQKEAYWMGIPCITLRDETEWTETVAAGWNILAGTNSARIIELVRDFAPPVTHPKLYGEGNVSARCVGLLG